MNTVCTALFSQHKRRTARVACFTMQHEREETLRGRVTRIIKQKSAFMESEQGKSDVYISKQVLEDYGTLPRVDDILTVRARYRVVKTSAWQVTRILTRESEAGPPGHAEQTRSRSESNATDPSQYTFNGLVTRCLNYEAFMESSIGGNSDVLIPDKQWRELSTQVDKGDWLHVKAVMHEGKSTRFVVKSVMKIEKWARGVEFKRARIVRFAATGEAYLSTSFAQRAVADIKLPASMVKDFGQLQLEDVVIVKVPVQQGRKTAEKILLREDAGATGEGPGAGPGGRDGGAESGETRAGQGRAGGGETRGEPRVVLTGRVTRVEGTGALVVEVEGGKGEVWVSGEVVGGFGTAVRCGAELRVEATQQGAQAQHPLQYHASQILVLIHNPPAPAHTLPAPLEPQPRSKRRRSAEEEEGGGGLVGMWGGLRRVQLKAARLERWPVLWEGRLHGGRRGDGEGFGAEARVLFGGEGGRLRRCRAALAECSTLRLAAALPCDALCDALPPPGAPACEGGVGLEVVAVCALRPRGAPDAAPFRALFADRLRPRNAAGLPLPAVRGCGAGLTGGGAGYAWVGGEGGEAPVHLAAVPAESAWHLAACPSCPHPLLLAWHCPRP